MHPINLEPIVLASVSPRRKELLEQVGIQLTIVPADIDETAVSFLNPEEYVKTLSCRKAGRISDARPDAWVLGADTIVVIQDQILGKPRTADEAKKMLCLLNGREHQVFTGFCIMRQDRRIRITRAVETRVFFRHLSDPEIGWYVDTGEPFDKAGAYGIQGIGSFLVKRISGSYSNVVGLPVCEVVETLSDLKLIQMRKTNHRDCYPEKP